MSKDPMLVSSLGLSIHRTSMVVHTAPEACGYRFLTIPLAFLTPPPLTRPPHLGSLGCEIRPTGTGPGLSAQRQLDAVHRRGPTAERAQIATYCCKCRARCDMPGCQRRRRDLTAM